MIALWKHSEYRNMLRFPFNGTFGLASFMSNLYCVQFGINFHVIHNILYVEPFLHSHECPIHFLYATWALLSISASSSCFFFFTPLSPCSSSYPSSHAFSCYFARFLCPRAWLFRFSSSSSTSSFSSSSPHFPLRFFFFPLYSTTTIFVISFFYFICSKSFFYFFNTFAHSNLLRHFLLNFHLKRV